MARAAPGSPGPPLSDLLCGGAAVAGPAGDGAVDVPEVEPRARALPEEDLPLDQTAVGLDRARRIQHLRGERLFRHGLEIVSDLTRFHREWDRHVPTLRGPLQANLRRMDTEFFGDPYHHWVLHVSDVAFAVSYTHLRAHETDS